MPRIRSLAAPAVACLALLAPAATASAKPRPLPVAKTRAASRIVAHRRGHYPAPPRVRLTRAQRADRARSDFSSMRSVRPAPRIFSPNRTAHMSIDGYEGPYATKLQWILYYVDRYWKSAGRSWYRTPVIYNDMRTYNVFRCGTSSLSLNNAWYCGNGNFITWDTAFLTSYFNWSKGGDMAVAAILAHEWGHATQAQMGLKSAKLNYSIWRELYADCQSGAWSADMARNGHLDNIAPGDGQEAVNTMYSLGDAAGTPWTGATAHGTGQQRYSFYVYGWNNGPQACVNAVL